MTITRRCLLLALPAFAASPIEVGVHCWVWASQQPGNDPYPVLETIFADCAAAGASGVELMQHVFLAHDDAVLKVKALSARHRLPCWGSSFSAPMWDASQKDESLKRAQRLCAALQQVQGKVLGLSVGDAGRRKTEAELDAQAACLQEIFRYARDHGLEPNLHNHTYEVRDGEWDLSGTLKRLPDAKLGPDLNWVARGGVDPVDFIRRHGPRIIYAHLRNQTAAGRWTEDLSQGAQDYAAIAKALRAAKAPLRRMAVELAFERDFQPTRPIGESIKLSLQHARSVFA